MILRLQSEKSSVEIDVIQFKRMAEQKQEYDQQVIESLQWIGMKHEPKVQRKTICSCASRSLNAHLFKFG
ncbi:hypothetical protein J1N35_014767 [Gossypium stocksii]|uniref:GTD-binding domain-containing protein n=1 Tax=Gossypium stocksii TaxID=47602 RepID=A0A9D3VX51_9ROSI|nr:hypothetical protein J1N35_014767 [Gossypium stocksii]